MRLFGYGLVVFAGWIAFWYGLRTPLGAVIHTFYPPFLNTLQAGVQRNISPELWNLGFLPVLELPGWLPLLGIGALCVVLGGGRRGRG
jgi:hypothetical protein